MRHVVALVVCLCAIVWSSSASAGVKTDGISYQGLLTDPSDHPIADGPHDLILSIWTDSVGGAMLHSELVVVSTSKGLFSTCIGCASSTFADLFTDQSLFLQTQLAGEAAMTPRTRLHNVPFSNSASSLHGEATSGSARSRGIVTTKPSGGTTQGLLLLDADSDGDGHADFTVTDSASTTSASRVMSLDSDDDGVPDNEISQSMTPTTCGVAIKTKGTGADANRVVSIQQGATPTDLSTVSSIDNNGDSDPESEISQSLTPTTCGVAIKTKGTGADPNRVVSIQQFATPTDLSTVSSIDNNGDSDPESEISQSLTPTTCGVAIKTKGTGADKNRTISSGCDDSSAVQIMEIDDDGDGIAEGRGIISVKSGTGSGSASASSRMTSDTDDDGIPENEASMSVTPTTSSVAIKTKGTGADANRVVSIQQGATPTDLSTVSSIDDDGDTVPESEISQTVTPTTCGVAIKVKGTGADKDRVLLIQSRATATTLSSVCAVDNDSDSVPESEIAQSLTPTTCGVAIKTKGTGADKNRTIASDCDDSSATQTMEVDDDGDGHAEARAAVSSVSSLGGGGGGGAASAAYARMTCDSDDDGVQDVTAEMVVDADSASLRLNGLPPGVPVTGTIEMTASPAGAHMTVGTATCDGSSWVNASDVNVKENFEQVNGEELLNQIDKLEVTKWNYKSDARTRHIGPTAQDFEATFGVGSDGKSISTIDPSGIALAAIKALNKQNRALMQENDALKQRLDALAQQVERLAASR